MTTYSTRRKMRLSVPVCFGNRHYFGCTLRCFRCWSRLQELWGVQRPRVRAGNIPFHIVFTALDFLMGMDSTIRTSPVFSRFNLHQVANRNPPKTASTFSHAGWMGVTECRSHSRDTGLFRSRPQSVDPLNIRAVSPNRRTKRVRQTRQKRWSRSTRRISEGACAD